MAHHRATPAAPTEREIELHSPWMRRLALALMGSADAADDVVQDAWARLVGAPTERGMHVGYLVGLVRALAHGRRRGEARRRSREAQTARVEALPSTAEVAARVEVARRLAEALEQLDEPYRTTLVLRYYDELSAAEIARRADIRAGTVRARLKRGLDLLRARLDDGEGGRASWMSALMPLLPAHPRSSAAGAATTTTLAASALLTMKLTLGATLCALAVLLAWTFVGREDAGGHPLDARADDGAALVASELADVADGAERRAKVLEGTQIDTTLVDTQPDGAALQDSRVTVIARATARDGRPLQGAWLRVELAQQHEARAELDGRLELELAASVVERLASVGDRRSVQFQVGAQGFETRSVAAEFVEGSDGVVLGDVVLRPGGAVHGHVVDESGLGVEGALVVFGPLAVIGAPSLAERDPEYHARRGPPHLDFSTWIGRTAGLTSHSGPGGAFRLDGVPLGYGVAWARTATSLWAYSGPIGLRSGDDVAGIELVVRDAKDVVISGRVVDPDGRAMAAIDLMFRPSGTDGSVGWSIERTDGDGGFHFVAWQGLAQDITVGWASSAWNEPNRIGVLPGTHDLVLAFERARSFEVTVRDPAGQPISNGEALGVSATGPTVDPLPRCQAPLDRDGQTRLRHPGQPLRVRIEAPGYRDALVGPFEPGTIPEPLVVTLEPVPALVGRVQLPDGRPAAGARVSLHKSAAGPGASAKASYLTHPTWSGDRDAFVYALQAAPTAEVRADGEGRFRLPLPGVDARAPEEPYVPSDSIMGALGSRGSASRQLAKVNPRQPWFVHAATEGHATLTSGPHVFDPAHDVSLDLELTRGGAIAGTLVLDGAASAHGWTARASDGLAEVVHAVVSEDGTFRFERLHAGLWQVRVFEPGRRFQAGGRMHTERGPLPDVHVIAGETVEYEHRAGALESARLAGMITIDGAPPGALVVSVRSSTSQSTHWPKQTTLDPDGRFEVAAIPGQRASLWIRGIHQGARLTLNADVDVAPGDNDWSFALETARLEVRVDPTGLPASPRQPAAYVAERGPITVRVTFEPNEPGHYGPFPVPTGRGRLDAPSATPGAPAPIWAELDLATGERRVLDLR